MGDSFYEYLLKARRRRSLLRCLRAWLTHAALLRFQMWLIGGRTPALAPYRRLWEDAMESMIAVLVRPLLLVPGCAVRLSASSLRHR
jgi:hypothetical protein